MSGGQHHPWRAFRRFIGWTLKWEHLPDNVMGHTDFEKREVTMAIGLNQEERRCTIDHETEHIRRGPVVDWLRPREELHIDRIVAHRLLPDVRMIADALVWANWDLDQAAEELWVDRPTLECRLRTMTHPAERAYMRRRFEEEP